MSSTWLLLAFLLGGVLLAAAAIVGLVFGVRALVRHNARQKQRLTRQQEELDRMKIDDL